MVEELSDAGSIPAYSISDIYHINGENDYYEDELHKPSSYFYL